MRHNNRRMKNNRPQGQQGQGQGGGHNNQGRRNNVPPRMQTFDSNGPDVRIRGTAWQVHEKYLALAKDAASSGDSIMAENYLQHAEHYQRIINAFNLPAWDQPAQRNDTVTLDDDGQPVEVEMSRNGQDQNQQPQPQNQSGAAMGVDQQQTQGRAQQQNQNQNQNQGGGQRDDDLGLPLSIFGAGATRPTALESA